MSLSIIPFPNHVKVGDGIFSLTERTVIMHDGNCEPIARQLQKRLRPATGMDFTLIESQHLATECISLDIDPSLPPSGYQINVISSGISLRGGDHAGLFHATQTLLQLLPTAIFRTQLVDGVAWEVAGVEITDQPRFGWRGMLLDVSRHYFGRDSILKLIDALALHRLNVLHLHLTDDQGWRIQIHRYPRLTEVGSWRACSAIGSSDQLLPGQETQYDEVPHDGYLSQDDLREIVAYAAERFISVIPEIDMPGHSQAAIAAYPHLGNTGDQLPVWTNWGVNPHVLNVEESTLEFYRNVLDEVLAIFPSEFIHIGGDECPKDEWRASPAVQARIRELGLVDEDELQSWFIGTFADFLAERGRRLVGWDEILEGGLPSGATVMSWRGVEGGVAAAEAGHDVIMTPDSETYLYHRQTDDPSSEPRGAEPPLYLQTAYDFDPMPTGLSTEAQKHVLGAQCQMWTEHVTSEREMHQMAFPRMSAFAEAVWRHEKRPFDDFESRLDLHFDRLHVLGIDAYRPKKY